MNNKSVSVIMLTYNHAPYLKEAIEGVLMQTVDFPFELIICNDASPDNSDEIIRPFAEQNQDKIRYYRQEKNIGFVENQRFAFQKATGKYIAYCEGDDYWTDENKLQFQVDFLENNPDFVMTTARNQLLHQEAGELTDDGKDYIFGDKEFVDYSQDSFFRERPTQTFTVMFRKELLDLKWVDLYPNYRDLYYFYHLLGFGKGRAFNRNIGVYRLHEGGVYSSLETEKKLNTSVSIFKNIKKINNDPRANSQIIKNLDRLINFYWQQKNINIPLFNRSLYATIFDRFMISKEFGKFVLMLAKTVKHSII